jgi:hypothetical protein
VLAEALLVLLEDVGDEGLGFLRQAVFRRPLVQVEDDQAPELRLAVAPGALRWQAGLVLRGLKALTVTLGP